MFCKPCFKTKCFLFMDVSSQQGLLKLENRAFLAINQVERKSLISKSNKGSSKNLACEQAFDRAGTFLAIYFPKQRACSQATKNLESIYGGTSP